MHPCHSEADSRQQYSFFCFLCDFLFRLNARSPHFWGKSKQPCDSCLWLCAKVNIAKMNLHELYNNSTTPSNHHNINELSGSTLECLSRLSSPEILPPEIRGRVEDYCLHNKEQPCCAFDKPSFGLEECLAQASVSPVCPSSDDELQLLSQVLATAYTRHKYRHIEGCRAQSSSMLHACIANRGSPENATDIMRHIDALLHSVQCIANSSG